MKREIRNMKTDLALHCVHIKMKMRGLLIAKDFSRVLVALVLLFSSTVLYAQDRSVDEIVTQELQAAGTPIAAQPIVQQETASFDTFAFPADYFPRFALKTNLLYGATTSMNIGAEFFLNRYLTLDLSLGWNPWVHRDNRKIAHWMVQPTLRYWIQEPFNGHFFGLSLMYSNFNVSDIRQPYNWFGVLPGLRDHRFRGDAYSVSIQYGHQWVLSPRWAIEASINVGYMFLDYRKYESGWCGHRLGSDQRHYFGPTNASISLIYVFR